MNYEPVPIGFPAHPWIPNREQLEYSGNVILSVAGAVLDQTPYDGESRGTVYSRRVLTTGQNVVFVPEQDGQMVVSLFQIALGRAGEQRFQFEKGTLGAYDQRYVRYQISLARSSPTVQGGISPRMQSSDALADAAALLWDDAYLVWSAMLAMSLGGVRNAQTGEQLSPAPITQDNLLPGPVAFDPPQGGLAVAKINLDIQM
jgi:hypothetical protein